MSITAIIVQKDKKFSHNNTFLNAIGILTIYSMIVPLFIIDIWTTLYQAIYFSIFQIPKVSKKDFIVHDRWKLKKLNLIQKINCFYCEYANGLLGWARAVANQTEVYSCAIKHGSKVSGLEYQKDFYSPDDFEETTPEGFNKPEGEVVLSPSS